MNKKVLILLLPIVLVFATLLVSAGDFQIKNATETIFTVAIGGDVNVSGGTIAEKGVLLSEIYLALAGGTLTGVLDSNSNITTSDFFVGSGKYLTDIPTYNVTYDTASAINWTELTVTEHEEDWTATYNATYKDYWITYNVTYDIASKINWTELTVTEHEEDWTSTYNATYAALSATDLTDVAYMDNETVWADYSVFEKALNVTGAIRLMTDDSVITGSTGETNISIDSSGNVIITLG